MGSKMNNKKREELKQIINQLKDIQRQIEKVYNEEEECFDNLSEGLQCTMRGMAIEEAVDNLVSADDMIEELIDYLEGAKLC